MPSFFTFQQGADSRGPSYDSSPLLGRFRAVPRTHRNSSVLSFSPTGRGLGIGYGSLFTNTNEDGEDSDNGNGEVEVNKGLLRRLGTTMRDIWVEPKQAVVARAVRRWWARWFILAVLPALLTLAWCALPFPTYNLPDDGDSGESLELGAVGHKVPGHGAARVEINFWYFLFVYYGLYNLTALMWITKVFNIYSLNWWPESLGFPLTVSIIALISILVPIPIYCVPESRFLTNHNTAWIYWTFCTMAMPLIIAFTILLNHERHLGLRHSLSETQRIFSSSWWTGDTETLSARDRARRPQAGLATFDPDAPLEAALAPDVNIYTRERALALRKRWLPASFVRFIWFCTALFIAMMAYVLGEAYAEIYLRTLPHTTMETIVYVYSWVVTVHVLDGLVGWILGGNDGERVGSYPLGWIFKLYFSLTYQTYVRALYARLRSPTQFIYLQILSSSFLIILGPLMMSKPFHSVLSLLSINNQPLASYRKFCARNTFLRTLSESVSMLAFLGSVLVLHYGTNKDVYPYFAFPQATKAPVPNQPANPIGGGDDYSFTLTMYASMVTWACELVAGWIVRRILWFGWKMDVTGEARADLGTWPELLPTGVIVMVHVLQNMMFSIARLKFH